MKISEYFKNPIKTFCEVRGVETDVIVEVDYQPEEEHACEYAEVTSALANGVCVIDAMTPCEKEDLEDRLLAMAKSSRESRAEDAAKSRWQSIADEMRDEELAQRQSQRRIGR